MAKIEIHIYYQVHARNTMERHDMIVVPYPALVVTMRDRHQENGFRSPKNVREKPEGVVGGVLAIL